ncbi:MAG TPA: hypothetical protein VFG20_02875 [Planctomycetaceae bacterium]|nr:hypothetical protein [Planctomycetaceae bacterium]
MAARDDSSMPVAFTGLWRLLRDSWQLLQSWWNVDRIRASPREGAFLRLPANSILQIDGESWIIETRWVCHGVTGPLVRFHCSNGITTATLEVRPSPFGNEQLSWRSGPNVRDLHPGEIEVYESAR